MATERTRYYCDICHREYRTIEAAEDCEAQGVPDPWPVGLVYGDHTPGAFYEKITFCVAKSSVDGHYRRGGAWACRDTRHYGDSLSDGELCEVRADGAHHLNTNAPHFKRMIAALREKGITPLVCVGNAVVEYKG